NFQLLLLNKRDSLFPIFENYCKKKNYTFRLPVQEIYDYCVLEYSFAFWQWGNKISSIPDKNASLNKIFNHFISVSSPSYFAVEEIEPTKAFFVQAYKQMGYYGYDIKPFKGLLKINDANNYLQKIFLPESAKDIEYDKEAMLKVQNYLNKNDSKMIFLYGEFDPWSATAVEFGKKENMYKIIKKGGSHLTRINNLPNKQKNKVINIINNWLKE
ncbi:MAG: aminopeptidase, partial [Bacteroidales bacterium]|nr:aminopeptidase [Bacteroidales bacterium]